MHQLLPYLSSQLSLCRHGSEREIPKALLDPIASPKAAALIPIESLSARAAQTAAADRSVQKDIQCHAFATYIQGVQ